MSSLKFKFTVFFAASIAIVVIAFSFVIYTINIVNARSPITPAYIQNLSKRNPRLLTFIETTQEIERLQELTELVRKEQRERFTKTLIVYVPPTIMVSAIFAYLVSSYLVKPIEDVAITLQLISSENLSMRVPRVGSSEEIEMLVDSFNNLLDELDGSFRSQEEFIQDAAHEMRTPLAAIKTSIDVFRDQRSRPKLGDYSKLLNSIENLNQKLIKLNEKLLFLNRSQKSKSTRQDLKINNLIEDVVESLKPLISAQGISISLDLDTKLPLYKANAEQLSLALKNLIENAVKYSSPKKGKVEIKSSQDSKSIKISIKDNGVGIKDEELTRIFDRFFRGANSEISEGEGLGLSIVDKVIRAHGGRIEVKSIVNEGSEFVVILKKIVKNHRS